MLSVIFALRWQSACLLMEAIPANALLDILEMVSAAAQVCLQRLCTCITDYKIIIIYYFIHVTDCNNNNCAIHFVTFHYNVVIFTHRYR